MKLLARILNVSFLVLISFTLASSQISIGLKGGINQAKDHSDNENINNIAEQMTSLYFAMPIEFQYSKNFAVQIEPGFVQKGLQLVATSENEYEPGHIQTMEMDTRMIFNYINFPVLAKGKFGSETVKLVLFAGPEVAYGLDAKSKIEMTVTNGTTETINETEEINFSEAGFDRWDYGLLFGFGFEVKLGPGWATFDSNYNLGLNNYNQFDDLDANKLYHRGIGILVGYKVPITVK